MLDPSSPAIGKTLSTAARSPSRTEEAASGANVSRSRSDVAENTEGPRGWRALIVETPDRDRRPGPDQDFRFLLVDSAVKIPARGRAEAPGFPDSTPEKPCPK